jgi:hypothetical protein
MSMRKKQCCGTAEKAVLRNREKSTVAEPDPGPFWPLDPGWVKNQDPDPGSYAFLTPGSGIGKKSGSGSGMNNPDHISESLETIFGLKYLNSSIVI